MFELIFQYDPDQQGRLQQPTNADQARARLMEGNAQFSSQWFGGKAEGWERAPYWLDGVIPLAWTLDDKPLQAKCHRYVKQMIAGQRADGWYA